MRTVSFNPVCGLGAALVALLLSSCSSAPTRVQVLLTMGDAVLARATSVRVRVIGGVAPEASEVVESRAIEGLAWPARAIIVPRDGDVSRPLRIEVEAIGANAQTLARLGTSTSFIEGETRDVWLHLDDECLGRASCEITSPCAQRDCSDGGTLGDASMVLDDAGPPACQPRAESCDGVIDEDCDGLVDEGCECTDGVRRVCDGGSDQGECAAGAQTCAGGRWGACEGRADPVVEDCNALDDDCDGRVDEQLMRACGREDRCVQHCEGGAWGSCGRRCDDDEHDD